MAGSPPELQDVDLLEGILLAVCLAGDRGPRASRLLNKSKAHQWTEAQVEDEVESLLRSVNSTGLCNWTMGKVGVHLNLAATASLL